METGDQVCGEGQVTGTEGKGVIVGQGGVAGEHQRISGGQEGKGNECV